MDLLLWRHAEAEPAVPGQSDLARALTPKGEQQARRIAAWLNTVLPADARILVSPAVRTQQTAHALGRPFDTIAPLAPDAPVEAVLAATHWPHGGFTLVVGHQPTLGLCAARLLCGTDQPWSIRKGAVWWLRHRDGEERTGPLLLAVRSPVHAA